MNSDKVRTFWREHEKDLVKFPCDLCGSSDSRKLNIPEKYGAESQLVQCTTCGLLYLNPRWNIETYDALYHYTYRSDVQEKEFAQELEKQLPVAARLLRIASGFRGSNKWERVLDIGCGYGALLWIAKHFYSAEVFGFEPDLNLANFCNGLFEGNILPKSVEEGIDDFISKRCKFDLIVCQQTLNHLQHPVKILKSLKKLLNSNGLIALEVLDFEAYTRMKGQRIQVDHTHYFTLRTLMAALRAGGFITLFAESDNRSGAKEKLPFLLPNRHIRCVSCLRPEALEGDYDEIECVELLLKETTPSILNKLLPRIKRFKNYLSGSLGRR